MSQINFPFPWLQQTPTSAPAHHHRAPVAHAQHAHHAQRDTFQASEPQARHHQRTPHQAGHAVHHGRSHQQGRFSGPGLEQAGAHWATGGGNNAVAANARAWNQQSYKPGQTKRCADWVSNILVQSGAHVRRSDTASGLAAQGQAVGRDNLKPGDTVFFGNTYKKGKYTHVGIYVGDGKFQHRPTANKPVQLGSLDTRYWATHFSGGRRY